MDFKENLYFIALIPRRELRTEVMTFQNDFAKRFDSKRALKVYPHITLKAPFKCPANLHPLVVNWFANLKISHRTFNIQLKNFDAFHNKVSPVVFINPVVTSQLRAIQNEIIRNFDSSFPDNLHSVDLDFKPHMTVAYRDLKPEQFRKAWTEYKNKPYTATFDVNGFHLLQHNTKKWNVIETYNLA